MGTEAVRLLVLWMAGRINSRQFEVIEFLRQENRVLREQLGGGGCGSPMTSGDAWPSRAGSFACRAKATAAGSASASCPCKCG